MQQTFGFVVEGVLLVAIGCLGCVGNCLCIATFARMAVQRNFHRLMLTLAVFDLIYITCSVTLFGLPTLFPWLYTTQIFKRTIIALLPVIHVGLTGSIYLTVAIALERYTTVCHPFFKVSHVWSAYNYIIPISIFSVLYNVPKCLELEVKEHAINMTETVPPNDELGIADNTTRVVVRLIERVDPTQLRVDPLYIKVYIIYLNLFVHGIIPLLLLVILNLCIYRQLRKHHTCLTLSGQGNLQQREVRLSQVSLLIVLIFILCHSLRWIPNIWEVKQSGTKKGDLSWPSWVQYVTQISHLATVINSSVNFFIYLLKHPSLFCGESRETDNGLLNGETDESLLLSSKKMSTCVVGPLQIGVTSNSSHNSICSNSTGTGDTARRIGNGSQSTMV